VDFMRIPLDLIVTDAGTQVRERLDPALIADYGAAMQVGAAFPPVILFSDGTRHVLADGFHRLAAAREIGAVDIEAEVREGTEADALWYALGANSTHGARLTEGDKARALTLAIARWPDRSMRVLAERIGCSSTYASRIHAGLPTSQSADRVVGADGVSYPASVEARQRVRERAEQLFRDGKSHDEVRAETGIGRDLAREIKRSLLPPQAPGFRLPVEVVARVEAMLREGHAVRAIHQALSVSAETIAKVRRAAGLAIPLDRTPAARADRETTMRQMAEAGYTSRQIAAKVGFGEPHCRRTLRRLGIEVPADRAVAKTKRHDSTRIIERIVLDAENVTECFDLMDFREIDRARIPEWLESLNASRDKLAALIRRLGKELANGQAA
jgi:ParB-like chromosome segregation protein Spo0J